MRRSILLLAASVLLAPSCPRDLGPADYNPDASRPFPAHDTAEDLVYVAGRSAKGDSVYVIAMPSGKVIDRIDGPDRRGWVFADATAYYAVTRTGGPTTIHRLDLRSGRREMVTQDHRLGTQIFDESGSTFTSLALSANGRELLVARLLKAGPRAWLGRYDVTTGALREERSWSMSAESGGVRFASTGDAYVIVAYSYIAGRMLDQQMRILDTELREIRTLRREDGLAHDEICSPKLTPITPNRRATVCSWYGSRQASVLIFDAAYRLVSRTTVRLGARQEETNRRIDPGTAPMGPPEGVTAWAGSGGAVGIVTDAGRHIRVTADGELSERALAEPADRIHIRAAWEVEPGRLAIHWILQAGTSLTPELVVVDVLHGNVLERSALQRGVEVGPLGFARAGDRIYGLVAGPTGPRLQRFALTALAPLGASVSLPQRDDVSIHGLIAVVPGARP